MPKGKVWGGGKPGRRIRLSVEKEKAIRQLHREGKPIAEIARVVGLSGPRSTGPSADTGVYLAGGLF